MGITAEFLAQTQGISREEQDEFALRSHQLAAKAQAAGEFKAEMIPIWGRDEAGNRILIDCDQCVRPDTSLAALAALEAGLHARHGHGHGRQQLAAERWRRRMLVMSEEKAHELGLKPLARVLATAVVGVDPAVMGTGPVPATHKALKRAGLSLKDIDLIELNEAFAAQALACIQMLTLDLDKVNVRGGAIAIGHPLGASGAGSPPR